MENEMGDAPSSRWARLRHQWGERLEPGEQATVLAWTSFTLTFLGLRGLTHWIRAGHGPSGGGMKMGGKHFHHQNIGIGLLATVAGLATGATVVAGMPFWPQAHRALRSGSNRPRA